ncbi:hypothetical protein THEYE_A2030 [Thermodesulfovibrio yellowstonii DSM 11347]|uniref:Uncharacterized protein n=1 Tax=Thermodesulfovibrio yellowstonii (strain ATCC 51303 / DSM 11347 / YP87) TaxID=289376 RepID=B5YIU3_THEYD|nr:hypothetical protein THEYE_A2030 [Thermodesulfovibrio yellowstonii DSM 11347]
MRYLVYNRTRLYIPHGSDETVAFKISTSFSKRLYIPHGSDETLS